MPHDLLSKHRNGRSLNAYASQGKVRWKLVWPEAGSITPTPDQQQLPAHETRTP